MFQTGSTSSPRNCEAYTPDKWIFSDPLGRNGVGTLQTELPKHPRDGPTQRPSVCIQGLTYAVHEDKCAKTVADRGISAEAFLGSTSTWKRNVDDSAYEKCRSSSLQLLPDRYVSFAIEPRLTSIQLQHLNGRRDTEFAYYFNESSHRGSYAFRSSLFSVVKRYAEARGCDQIYAKVGGTRHSPQEVTYIIVMCCYVGGRDPLPQLHTLDRSEQIASDMLVRPETFLNNEGKVLMGDGMRAPKWATTTYDMPRFAPHAHATAMSGQRLQYDALEFAFHFPSGVLSYPLLLAPLPVEHSTCVVAEQEGRGCMEAFIQSPKKRRL